MNDAVNHPKHYTSHPSGVECIQISREMDFDLGNAFKYCWRAGLKNADRTEDLAKSRWYLRDWLNTTSSDHAPGFARSADEYVSEQWHKVREATVDKTEDVFVILQHIYDAHRYKARDNIWRAGIELDNLLRHEK